jgi:hypothetical protein
MALVSSSRREVKYGLLLGLFVLAVFLGAVAIVLYMRDEFRDQQNALKVEALRADYVICVAARTNRKAIRDAILAGDPLDLRPGDYGYSYAQAHPEEARRQHEKIKAGEVAALALFPEIKCPPRPPGVESPPDDG